MTLRTSILAGSVLAAVCLTGVAIAQDQPAAAPAPAAESSPLTSHNKAPHRPAQPLLQRRSYKSQFLSRMRTPKLRSPECAARLRNAS